MILGWLILIVIYSFVVWAIIDVLKTKMKDTPKLLWVGGLLLFSIITLVVWLFIRKRYKRERR